MGSIRELQPIVFVFPETEYQLSNVWARSKGSSVVCVLSSSGSSDKSTTLTDDTVVRVVFLLAFTSLVLSVTSSSKNVL